MHYAVNEKHVSVHAMRALFKQDPQTKQDLADDLYIHFDTVTALCATNTP